MLLKHSKSWINGFSALTGAEVKVLAAAGTEALAILSAEELGLHIQNEASGEDFVQIYLVTLKQEQLRIVSGILFHDGNVQDSFLYTVKLSTAAVADAGQIRSQRTLQREDASLVENTAFSDGACFILFYRRELKTLSFELTLERNGSAGDLNYFSKIKPHI